MNSAAWRSAWLTTHRWLGLTLGLVGALLGISGSLLVFDGAIDARLNPQRYAVSGGTAALPFAEYVDAAANAAGAGARPVALQLPAQPGDAVVVVLRSAQRAPVSRVYLDPPTARVLDVARGGGLVEWLHRFHGSLMLREFRGREIVGVVGMAMFISALSGIYLWWPGRAAAARALVALRPRLALSRNLHYLCGFYASIVLAVIAYTGVYLAFPIAVRGAVDVFSPGSFALRGNEAPVAPRVAGPAPEHAVIGIDRAADIARAMVPGAAVASIALPARVDAPYRVALRESALPHRLRGGNAMLLVDAQSGAVRRRVDAATRTGGDGYLAWQAPLHTGEAFGMPGRIVVCIAGLAPALLLVTGVLMWLRPRRARHALARRMNS